MSSRIHAGLKGIAGPTTEFCYLKIGTQGYDLEVLKGTFLSLQDVRALQFELAVQPLYSDVPQHLDMLKNLDNCGYDLAGKVSNFNGRKSSNHRI